MTGSNKGIGLGIVRALCNQYQGTVYLTSRDKGRGEATVEQLKAEVDEPNIQTLKLYIPFCFPEKFPFFFGLFPVFFRHYSGIPLREISSPKV